MIANIELANEIIRRLNDLISSSDICEDVQNLIEHRIQCSETTMSHSSIQIYDDLLGFLGLLNGVIGTIPDGEKKGWGYIAASYNDDNSLTHFLLTTSSQIKIKPEKDLNG